MISGWIRTGGGAASVGVSVSFLHFDESPANNGTSIDALKLQAGAERALVFVGPYEHHSNLLPWREGGVDVVTIPEDDCGNVCLAARPAAQSASRSVRRALLNATGQSRVTLSPR